MREMAIGVEVTENDAPLTHVHEIVRVKVEPIVAKAPRPGKLAVADSAVVVALLQPQLDDRRHCGLVRRKP